MPKLMKPSFSVVCCTPDMMDVIEDAARKCYLSEPKHPCPEHPLPEELQARLDEQAIFLRSKIALGHHSVLEHGNITVDFVFDRGVSHEEVRHRLQAISQESTRYCNYSLDKYENEIAVIEPFFFNQLDPREDTIGTPFGGMILTGANKFDVWLLAMRMAEWAYLQLLSMGATAQEARDVLPNSLKTEMRCTMNVREWRHVLKIRTESGVHPQFAQVSVPCLQEFKTRWPVLFEDIVSDPKWDFFLLDTVHP